MTDCLMYVLGITIAHRHTMHKVAVQRFTELILIRYCNVHRLLTCWLSHETEHVWCDRLLDNIHVPYCTG
jgi:hypothetical protein